MAADFTSQRLTQQLVIMLGRILLTLEDVMLLFGASAGWNETRIHNPRWPPHARRDSLRIAGFLESVWAAHWASLLYPRTSGLDFEFGGLGFPQKYLFTAAIGLAVTGRISKRDSECVGVDTGAGVLCRGPGGTQREGDRERRGTGALSRLETGGCFVRFQAT
ncbi:uncharacterized protein GLRG_10484 [Colletotrichum graminicola M1.001]|uniref:Uncharacterized protein n=1 Tax=Colletotrichum graminicola (strain M1.001 / M2 / FGSC 10212) TaxID=645133 RepID=E3QWV2_COLGM|nr:uncharacterized protein GLRG_10484 [Colletotrichum graminicola M1.001]EFQ35340.1 hypothetical protein GLRG_10484 [Colletotrichum graminicola M1.001]